MKTNEIRVIISGGGTGGHIFPAISIANTLKKEYPFAQILFVGAENKMEMERVPAAGYSIIGLPIVGLQRKLTLKNLTLPFKMIRSSMRASRIVDEFKPDVVVGVGGYAAWPVLRAAQQKKIPTLIQEQNSYAGLANKKLGKRAMCICTAYQNMERFFPKEKIVLTGNPIREDLFNLSERRKEALSFFNLDEKKKTILLLGGSLGARTMNESVMSAINDITVNDIQLIWQSGKYYYSLAKETLEKKPIQAIKLYDFISRMDLAYSAADLIVSRAGAGTISELCVVGKACILVPSPNVAEDHQSKNANALVEKNAALAIKDSDAEVNLFKMAFNLLEDQAKMSDLAFNIQKMAKPNAAKEIVENIVKLKRN